MPLEIQEHELFPSFTPMCLVTNRNTGQLYVVCTAQGAGCSSLFPAHSLIDFLMI